MIPVWWRRYTTGGQGRAAQLRELCEQIPMEHLRLTQDLIEYIRGQLATALNESLLISPGRPHRALPSKRKQEGIDFSNPLQGAIMCYYPAEYRLGQHCLRVIREQTQTDLSESEAAFIALHIVNAELNTNMTDMYDITRLIEGTLAVVEYYYQRTFDRESLDFSRFAVHLRYFAQRLFQAAPGEGGEYDPEFQEMIIRSCRQHYKCAQHIRRIHPQCLSKEVCDEELIYLTIHLKRHQHGWEVTRRRGIT